MKDRLGTMASLVGIKGFYLGLLSLVTYETSSSLRVNLPMGVRHNR